MKNLDIRKFSAKWIPKCLNADQKRQTCRSSEQHLEFFFASAIQMISCRDWWPWRRPGYITMTRRQSNSQWIGGIVAHPAPNLPSAKILWKSSHLDFLRSRWHSPDGLSSKEPKYQLVSAGATGGHFEGKALREFHQGDILARQFPVSPGTFNPEETGLPGLPVSWSLTLISGSDPVGLPPVPWTVENNRRVAIFRWTRRSLLPRDLVGRTSFWFFLVTWKC